MLRSEVLILELSNFERRFARDRIIQCLEFEGFGDANAIGRRYRY
jgi:hypothetical protein